jgi:rubrerythrin
LEGSSITASAVITFAENLEEQTSKFYEQLAKKYPNQAFVSYTAESRKNGVFLVRTYRETITDALEACFSFEGIALPSIDIKEIKQDTTCEEDIKSAIKLEEASASFYREILKCSESLMSTIARSFEKVAKNREKRKQELESILKNFNASTS